MMGKNIIVGGPSEMGGSELVSHQDAHGNQPCVAPGLELSSTPLQHPALVQHSSTPSFIPSLQLLLQRSSSSSPSITTRLDP